MLKNFVDKYASFLNGKDVKELFTYLRELMNRSEAARICDIERRTTYYWENNREVRLTTRKKVLRAIFKKDFEYAVKYLLKRVHLSLHDMLGLYLGTIYEKTMNPDITPNQFETLMKKFLEIRVEYSQLITPKMAPEILDMYENLKERANELGIVLNPLPMSVMNVEELMILLPKMINVIPTSIDDSRLGEFSNSLNISKDFVKYVADLKNTLTPEVKQPPISGLSNWDYSGDVFRDIRRRAPKRPTITNAMGGYGDLVEAYAQSQD